MTRETQNLFHLFVRESFGLPEPGPSTRVAVATEANHGLCGSRLLADEVSHDRTSLRNITGAAMPGRKIAQGLESRRSSAGHKPQSTRPSVPVFHCYLPTERTDHGTRHAAQPRSPQDLGPQQESEQPLQRLVPQPRPTDRVRIQDDLSENVHVVTHAKMDSKREPLLPDIDDAHNAINSNIIQTDDDLSGNARPQRPCSSSRMSASRLTSTKYGSSDIKIPQTQYLLNQIAHENNVTAETAHIQNSLSDLDSKKLKFEADKILSNLLLDGELRNEISEQNDSGICTVTSESTSLYDKNPEKKGTFATGNQQEGHSLDKKDTLWNTSCSCSNVSSPKRKSSMTSDSSYVCALTSVKTVASLDHSIGCENSPSQSVEKIWTKSKQYAQNDIATSRKTKNSNVDYDYSDLGLETNVSAIDDVATIPVKNLSYNMLRQKEVVVINCINQMRVFCILSI
ncbi:hypothetical protein WN51_12514 [Melipona quadrifasciata]|uniref:Uncharacterized protein n=1 Tax=Melipona quadrifasciata TaxID=166423 RepID=A0A0M9A2R5_9HYME|nr:hypothetical protein WN51_12514 [Melipona quadrifasciata]